MLIKVSLSKKASVFADGKPINVGSRAVDYAFANNVILKLCGNIDEYHNELSKGKTEWSFEV
jgi:hypothetical protein